MYKTVLLLIAGKIGEDKVCKSYPNRIIHGELGIKKWRIDHIPAED